jgi:glycerophosphoryl diester phosphodiesterase
MNGSFFYDLPRPLLFAHRGLSAKAPENTMPAFKTAWEHGIPGIELDVRMCASGELVVFHDETLERTTGTDGYLEATDIETLRSLDAGSYFGEEFAGTGIPLLSEVVEAAPEKVYFDIEMKVAAGNAREMALSLGRFLSEHEMENRCIISSFYPTALREIKIAAPSIPTAFIYSEELVREHRIQNFLARRISATPILKPEWPLTKAALKHHRPLVPWTVNDPEQARFCIDLGAAGIISDDPTFLL